MIRKSFKKIIGLVLCGFVISGCSLIAGPADLDEETPRVVLTGTIVGVGDKFTLVGQSENVDLYSRKVDLIDYDGKTVTVEGEYSGSTLFVDQVK